MKKIIYLMLSLAPFSMSFGQTSVATEKRQYAVYNGCFDSVSQGESSHIYVKLFLSNDSTYSYEIGGVFSWCTSQTLTGSGKWLIDNNWIYFKPDTIGNGTNPFVMDYSVLPLERTKNENQLIWKHLHSGYDHALPITKGKKGCDEIAFRIPYDCFKRDWPDRVIRKVDCK
jgi:hypothetical protein